MSKTALITGASGGIGLELARIHASKGDNLVLVARSGDKLSEIKSEFEAKYNVSVRFLVRDLSVPHAAIKVYDEVTNHGIEIDYLVNNAGFGDFGLFAESDWDKQERMININITALAHLTRLFLPGMIKRGEGRILNVASLAAFTPGPTMAVYFASKAFVLSFSEALNNEVKGKGITVTALCPGSTESKFHEVAIGDPKMLKERKMMSAEEVAEIGYNAMMKGKTVVLPGFKNALLATLTRFIPRDTVVKSARKIQENKNYRKL
ncbi:MAG TPA: SDR family oxidoreductase [Bacteroidales bacterium]|nr:SDR family oxidoreductase [Bacteroidales bacterium]